MPDFPQSPLLDCLQCGAICPASLLSIGPGIVGSPSTTTWPAANRAIFVPFRVPFPATVYQMATGTGTGTTGNFDLGIYDQAGNRIVSTGSTAKTTASSERIVNITDTLLLPGFYYLAMATDGTTNYAFGTNNSAALGKLAGLRQMDTAFALPATATFATISTTHVPLVSAWLRAD